MSIYHYNVIEIKKINYTKGEFTMKRTTRQRRRKQMMVRRRIFTSLMILTCIMIIGKVNKMVATRTNTAIASDIVYEPCLSEDIPKPNIDLTWEELASLSEEAVSIRTFETEPLSLELQEYANTMCEEYDFPIEVFMALMKQESDYRADAYNPDGSYGITQIRYLNHDWLNKELDVDDFFDARQNMDAGLFILSHYREVYKPDSMHMLLMMYNMGPNRAKKSFAKGIYSSEYSRSIMEHAKFLGYEM